MVVVRPMVVTRVLVVGGVIIIIIALFCLIFYLLLALSDLRFLTGVGVMAGSVLIVLIICLFIIRWSRVV
jgi:hypothetical protein